MTPTRVIDTHRLSILANEYERDMVQFLRDLIAIPVAAPSTCRAFRTEADEVVCVLMPCRRADLAARGAPRRARAWCHLSPNNVPVGTGGVVAKAVSV